MLDQSSFAGLVETTISHLLEYSDIEAEILFCFAHFRMERMSICGQDRNGYTNVGFLWMGESLIMPPRLFKKECPLKNVSHLPGDKKGIAFVRQS